jgi:RNA polymerase sigma factor (sigma-70 family)
MPRQGLRTVSDQDEAAAGAGTGDTTLAELVADGDQDALAELYQRHGPACYRLARQITASGSLAEDAVQEAFAGLWQAPRSYRRARGSVRNWLLALTHHKAVDLVRRETAERRRMTAEADRLACRPPGEDPAATAWNQIAAAEVRAALQELPEHQRRSLALAYFGGYTQGEVAALTGVPLGTVKSRTFTALAHLRDALDPFLNDPA